jgi:hypothetical protein
LELDQKFCSWLEQIKNSVIRTNVTLVWQEGQSLRLCLFLGVDSDSAGMECMIALFQERTALGNESCVTLSLLFPMVKDSGR